MSVSTHLFQLIHSLNQSEKRYFKIFSSFQAGSKVYIELFDAIARQKEYDEKKLKDRLKIKAFATAKNYLYGLILRSLRSQQQDKNISLELKDLLKDIEILFQKGLYEQSSRLLVKAKKLAQDYEKFPLLLEILQSEHLIANVSINPVQHKKIFEDGPKEVAETMSALKEQLEYRRIINLLIYKRSMRGKLIRSESDKKEVLEQAHILLDNQPENLLSYKTGMFHHNIKELYYYSINDIEGAYQNSKNSIRHLESNPMLLTQELNNYMFALNNLMNAQMSLYKYEEIKSSLDKLKSIPAITPLEKERIFGFSASKEIIYFSHTGRYKEGLERVPIIEKNLELYKDKIHKPACYSIYAKIEELYIVCGKFKQALHWNNKILNDLKIESFYDFYSNARISEIVIHYELENIEKVQSLIKSYYQFLLKNKEKYKYEYSLIRFFKNLIPITNQHDLKKEFIRFHQELIVLERNPYEKEAFDFFDLTSWLQSKIENRPFTEIMNEKMGKS